MYFCAANAAYTGGNDKKAFELLKSILENGRCIEDKLDAYYLYAMMQHSREQSDEGYDTCINVLQQLGETLPATITMPQLYGVMKDTGMLLGRMSDADIQLRFSTDNSSSLRYTIKFYSQLCCLAYWKSPQMMIWGSCRSIKLSLDNGICPDSLFSFFLYSGTVCMQSKSSAVIKEACRVGKAVISLVNRPGFQSTLIVPRANFVYYGLVAIWTESLQLCTTNLRKGFEGEQTI